MLSKGWFKIICIFTLVSTTTLIFFGCGAKQQKPAAGAQVKAMAAIQQDTPLIFEYAGEVKGTNEVAVQSRVSGSVVDKYIHGGEQVSAGQALYRIDGGNYISALNQTKATLAQSQAQLSNAQQDLSRYTQLINSDAISDQTYTNQQQTVAAYQAVVEANMAQVNKAQKDYDDTIVRAPIDGRLDVNDVATGVYATAGNTTLVTLGTVNPVYVQFSISENEYLKFNKIFNGNFIGKEVSLTLSDGSDYPITGKIAQIDRSMGTGTSTGTLTVKALFNNPDTLLMPGMFARVKLTGETVKDAILVPQRAVQQLLNKSFVMIVGDDGKSVSRVVTLGPKVGSYYIIQDGINPGDNVVVEGLTKLREGVPLNVTTVTADQLGLSLTSGDNTSADAGTDNNADSDSSGSGQNQ
ncbi:efflux RND transporter periplasmic adaptor subunit [Pectinatus frisingensis]|uniref:efflux RND transporter periplasmic adaptor subunit n=1 Tax=Pectinatus frisingensis TaxID=865 RepID=UPI001E31CEA3|nr:efflux RND transporter periplasmic adaptor subunit [Pectinatus frisingensis]